VQGAKFVDYISTQQGAAAFLATLPNFIFILKGLESSSAFGALAGLTLDTMLAALSTSGEMFQNFAVLIPGFGPAIVAVFGIFFWPPLAMISLSQKDFSGASETFLKAIPLGLGKTLSTAFAKTDRLATKFGDRYGEISAQVQTTLDNLKETLVEAKQNVDASLANSTNAVYVPGSHAPSKETLEAAEKYRATAEAAKAADDAKNTAEADARAAVAPAAAPVYKPSLITKLPYEKKTKEELEEIASQEREPNWLNYNNGIPEYQKTQKMNEIIEEITQAKEELAKRSSKSTGGRRKRLSTKKRNKKNKTWRKTKRTRSARR